MADERVAEQVKCGRRVGQWPGLWVGQMAARDGQMARTGRRTENRGRRSAAFARGTRVQELNARV